MKATATVKKTAKQPKAKNAAKPTTASTTTKPKSPEDIALVAEIAVLIQAFTKEVQSAAEKRGITVDVAVHIVQKDPT